MFWWERKGGIRFCLQFRLLAEKVLEMPWLASDARFAENRERVEHREELVGLITARLREEDERHWVDKLSGLG